MHGYRLAFVTPIQAPSWQRWLVFSPVARLVFFTALLVAASMLFGLVPHGPAESPVAKGLRELGFRAVAPLLAYLVLVKLIERRPVRELALRRLAPEGALGLAAGALLFSAVVGSLWLLGSYRIIGTNPEAHWMLAALTVGLGAGIGEEIICRGVLYRIVEEGLGSWIALLVSALFFGAAHLNNPGATLWAGLAIAIEAGILFGLIYLVTRSLWICMGLHAAWNFMQGTVYGIPVSGTRADGWLVSTRSGPDWLSGGVFGAEASVVALVLCTLVSAMLLAVALRRGLIVPPGWRRQGTEPRSGSLPMPTPGS
ncbi:CPBP family intramembrane metalloprotease [Frateuria edaphi]|jgi:membrane protease YdiL (CAAX protease family)|uniref:CPBP family intramembrane glutamic endopeptidase n=1 Tax=Frateuria TaxID=70411 RepID=UPI001E335FEA|nr:type II CAAX endopeptidase family protein [Frateuria edaphi]UGB44956.1 CPBP family intramembrane metalloprotease [Frateuria edaphi]